MMNYVKQYILLRATTLPIYLYVLSTAFGWIPFAWEQFILFLLAALLALWFNRDFFSLMFKRMMIAIALFDRNLKGKGLVLLEKYIDGDTKTDLARNVFKAQQRYVNKAVAMTKGK